MKHPTLSKYFSYIIRGSLSATTHLLLTMAIRLSPEEWIALSHEIKLPSYDHTIGYWEDLRISTFISLVKGLKHDHPFQIVSSQRLGLDLPGQWIQKPHPGQTPIHAEWTLWTCIVAGTRETPDPLSDKGEKAVHMHKDTWVPLILSEERELPRYFWRLVISRSLCANLCLWGSKSLGRHNSQSFKGRQSTFFYWPVQPKQSPQLDSAPDGVFLPLDCTPFSSC